MVLTFWDNYLASRLFRVSYYISWKGVLFEKDREGIDLDYSERSSIYLDSY